MSTKNPGNPGAGIGIDNDPKTDSPSISSTSFIHFTDSPSISSTGEDGMIHISRSVIHETALSGHRGQMDGLKTYEEEILSLLKPSTPIIPLSPLLCPSTEDLMGMMGEMAVFSNETIELEKHQPFITTTPEIIQGIFKHLNPVDTVCFSLMNKYIHNIYLSLGTHHIPDFKPPLQIGRPESKFPVIPGPQHGCRHCCPVAFFPAHCELHFHLKSFMPSNLTFCAGQCQKFTSCEPYDSKACGMCGRGYRKQFERGRRMINVKRPNGSIHKWYEQPRLDRENRDREDRLRLRITAQA
ncbi:hypothetical protein SBOR_9553 [Sclerotinia borealis F-4128]|uniref:F-box domain-containing protein n=1 Tax=Sclerotinia borealis (strain F-4128) TaxID=1432307 RepID=W9C661_SCLBF|nr:hypothetical protein SBOR_9553 [Sclerotinia borealis F-4128]